MSSSFGVDLPATVTFDYPTIDALAGYIAQQLGASAPRQQDIGAHQAALAVLLDAAAALLGAEVAADQPLMEAGLDSIGEWGSGRFDCCMASGTLVFAPQS